MNDVGRRSGEGVDRRGRARGGEEEWGRGGGEGERERGGDG